MAKTPILIDSSFLYAAYSSDDKNHVKAQEFAFESLESFIVPDVVLPEVTFLFRRRGGVVAVAKFLEELIATAPRLLTLTIADLDRVLEITSQYRDASLDFVDCCIMALSERMNITRVCTFDRRDFSIFRPNHCDYLELLP
jgi:hypothetical protein